MIKSTCACGLNKDSDTIAEYRYFTREDKKYFGQMGLNRCKHCSLVHASPMPSPDTLELYYKKIYRKKGKPHFRNNPWSVHPSGYEISQYEYISKFVDMNKIESVLDIGAGYGFLLREIRERHQDIRLYFDDYDAKSTAYLNKYGILKFVRGNDCLNKVDLVISSHNLEHFNSPDIFFERAKEILKPGGHLFIEVPNSIFDTDKWNKMAYDSPHLLFFSKESLRFFLERHNFVLLNVNTNGYSVEKELELMRAEQKNQCFTRKFRHKIGSILPQKIKVILNGKMSNMKMKDDEELSSEHFRYGGERRAIRAMATL